MWASARAKIDELWAGRADGKAWIRARLPFVPLPAKTTAHEFPKPVSQTGAFRTRGAVNAGVPRRIFCFDRAGGKRKGMPGGDAALTAQSYAIR